MTVWYLNNSDEPDDAVIPDYKEGYRQKTFREFVECGVWISDTTWIPPHRILRVDDER